MGVCGWFGRCSPVAASAGEVVVYRLCHKAKGPPKPRIRDRRASCGDGGAAGPSHGGLEAPAAAASVNPDFPTVITNRFICPASLGEVYRPSEDTNVSSAQPETRGQDKLPYGFSIIGTGHMGDQRACIVESFDCPPLVLAASWCTTWFGWGV